MRLGKRRSTNAFKGQTNIALITFWDQRLNSAQKRFLHCVEVLARVRRDGVTINQLIIAGRGSKQVNIANDPIMALKE